MYKEMKLEILETNRKKKLQKERFARKPALDLVNQKRNRQKKRIWNWIRASMKTWKKVNLRKKKKNRNQRHPRQFQSRASYRPGLPSRP